MFYGLKGKYGPETNLDLKDYIDVIRKHIIENVMLVPCVSCTATTTYLIFSLFKSATEYLNAGVTAQEKEEVKSKRALGGVGWRPTDAM